MSTDAATYAEVVQEQGSTEPASEPRQRGRTTDLLGVGVSVVALGAVVAWARGQEPPSFPTSATSIGLLLAGVGVYALATLVRGVRWSRILQRAGVGHAPIDAHALVTVGYMGNTVLPARGGELLRIFLLAGRSQATKRQALGSIAAERLLDAAALVALFAVLTWVGVAGTPTGQLPAAVGAAAIVAAAAAVPLYLRARAHGGFESFARFVRPFSQAARPLVGRFGAALLGLTMLVWAAEAVICVLIGQAIDVSITPVDGLFVIVLASFFAMIPAAPGFVGTFDAAVLFALGAVGVAGAPAITFMLLLRFTLFVPVTLAGLGFMVARYGGLRVLRKGQA